MKRDSINKTLQLTILVPCFNVEKYIDQCLRSLQNQTLKNFRVICINDGSEDNTLNVIRSYVERDSRFSVLDKKNSGYGDSMNCGLSLVKTKYVGIVESDDFVDPDMFEVLLKNAKKRQLDISRCGFYSYYDDNNQVQEDFPFVPKGKVIEPIKELSVFYQPPSIWCSIYRLGFLKTNNIKFLPTPGASYQDTSFAFKAYFKCKRFMMIDRGMLHYRQHAESSVRSTGKALAVCTEWDEIIKYVSNDKNRFAAIKGCLADLLNGTYKWNVSRLDPELQYDFIKKWRADIRKLEAHGVNYHPRGIKKKIENAIFRKSAHLYIKYNRLIDRMRR